MTAICLLTDAQIPARLTQTRIEIDGSWETMGRFSLEHSARHARTLSCSSGNSNEVEYPSHKGKCYREDRDKHGQCLPFDDLSQYQHLGQ